MILIISTKNNIYITLKQNRNIMKQFFLFIFFVTAVLACKEDEKTPCITMVQAPLSISILDKNNNDLLNPNSSNAYKTSEVVFYKDSTFTKKRYEFNDIDLNVLMQASDSIYYLNFIIPIDYLVNRNGKNIYCSESYLKLNNKVHTIYTEQSEQECNKKIEKIIFDNIDVTELGKIAIIVE